MAKKYKVQPARGQALLNFQGRREAETIELFETEKLEEVKSKTNELNLKETDLNPDFKNLVINGDCLSACAYLKSKNIKVDLVYIDPPFASGANYAKKIYLRNKDKNTLESGGDSIGEEIMYGDIWQKEDYLNWLYERLLAIRDIMSDTGSIYLHLDWHIGHYAKILMDEIFGEENFVNEVIWGYRTGGGSKKSWNQKHDVIFYYSKSPNYIFNQQKEKAYTKSKSRKAGIVDYGGGTAEFFKDEQGVYNLVKARDIWDDISYINSQAEERLDYSTQKPEALLERIIKASSNEKMVVADFFGGSGVSAKVSNSLNRKFITCDIGINAIQTIRDRLVENKASFDILKIKDGMRLFRNPTQTNININKMFNSVEGFKSQAELELTKFWKGGLANTDGSYSPLHFVGIDKKLTKELLDVIMQEITQLEVKGNDVYILYAHKELEVNQKLVNQEAGNKTRAKVILIGIDEFLGEKANNMFMPDNASISIDKTNDGYKVKINSFYSPYLKSKIDDFNDKSMAKGKAIIELSESGLELIEAVQFDTTLKDIWNSDTLLEDKAKPKEKIKGEYLLKTNKFKIKIRNISGDEIIISSEELK